MQRLLCPKDKVRIITQINREKNEIYRHRILKKDEITKRMCEILDQFSVPDHGGLICYVLGFDAEKIYVNLQLCFTKEEWKRLRKCLRNNSRITILSSSPSYYSMRMGDNTIHFWTGDGKSVSIDTNASSLGEHFEKVVDEIVEELS